MSSIPSAQSHLTLFNSSAMAENNCCPVARRPEMGWVADKQGPGSLQKEFVPLLSQQVEHSQIPTTAMQRCLGTACAAMAKRAQQELLPFVLWQCKQQKSE